ncbi:MAG: type IIA DNA topoisomerase subunit B [Candidatus Paceibacterota bacterium]
MTSKEKQNQSYTAKDIEVLEGLEPVRKRPGMYIGSTGSEGLHHLIYECVDNAIDEALAGYAKNIEVCFYDNNRVSIEDDGRGIPVDVHKKTKKSALETVLSTLHAGGKFSSKAYKVSGGLHGVGVSVVNALSKYLRAEVYRDGFVYYQEYSKGKPLIPVKKDGKTKKTGTKILFEPDPEIFSEIKFDIKKVIDHLRYQAFLTPKITIRVKDFREKKEIPSYILYFENGIGSFLTSVIRDYKKITKEVFFVSKEKEGAFIEIALAYVDDTDTVELSFANNIYTSEGGMHLTGFRSALTRVLNNYGKETGALKEETFTGEDVREGLIAIVSVRLPDPQFEGQTKAKLGNPYIRTLVEQVFSEAFKEWLEVNKEDGKRILEKCLLSAQARLAAKKVKENILRKGVLEGASLPGKLADCITKKAEEAELFIVEGDSAGGSAKSARDRNIQAILPLRGKILNVEKARFEKMMSSEEIKALIIALGTAILENFDLDKLRYHKIIIMTDADSDGAHIRTLLLTLFYRYFKPVILNNYLYIAQPPLYKIQVGKNVYYAYTESEKEKILKEILGKKKEAQKKKEKKLKVVAKSKGEVVLEPEKEILEEETENLKGVTIQRYKGLGEMNPQELWETTMDPQKRILKQVAIEDAEEADKLFDILMGEQVLPRKKFIQAYAQKVKNLDI